MSCILFCFVNNEKENKRIYYSISITNEGDKTLLSFILYVFIYLSIYLFIHLLIWFQTFNKKIIPTRNSTHYKEFITVFTNLYLRVKKLSCTWSCINQDIYTFLFYFLRDHSSHSSHSLHHTSLGISISSLILRQRAQPFPSGRCPFFNTLHLGVQIFTSSCVITPWN